MEEADEGMGIAWSRHGVGGADEGMGTCLVKAWSGRLMKAWGLPGQGMEWEGLMTAWGLPDQGVEWEG